MTKNEFKRALVMIFGPAAWLAEDIHPGEKEVVLNWGVVGPNGGLVLFGIVSADLLTPAQEFWRAAYTQMRKQIGK